MLSLKVMINGIRSTNLAMAIIMLAILFKKAMTMLIIKGNDGHDGNFEMR